MMLIPSYGVLSGTDQARQGDEDVKVIVADKKTTMADLGIQTTEWGWIKKLIDATLEKCPEGYKARVTLTQNFSNHPDHYGVNYYARSIVPLNPQGQPDGEETIYGPPGGGSLAIVPWKNGVKDGVEKVYDGSNLRAETPWKDGKIHGVKRTCFANGKLQSETTYEDGVANGPTRSYGPDGKVVREGTMRAGKRHGTLTDYWPGSDKPKRTAEYDMGRVVGLVREFYASGQLKREVPFRDNTMHGIEKEYDITGKVIRTRYWVDGNAVSQEEYEKSAGK